MIWIALLIPLLFAGVCYLLFPRKIQWWELFIPTGVSVIAILISYYSMRTVAMHDVEYNGYIIVEARYYEQWSTWVDQTCYTHSCSTDANGNQTCVDIPYDCSYCDDHSAYWKAIDNFGHEYSISQAKYEELMKKWNAIPVFNELNRYIHKHGRCGVDGDMYSIKWDGRVESSEANVIEVGFTNYLKLNHSAFNYPVIKAENAKKQGLFSYPKQYDYYKQNAILGMDSFPAIYRKGEAQVKFEYLNGDMGPKNKVKVFTLLFKNKPIDIAFVQEAYWEGGNQNEIVVCMSLDDTLGIQWVKPFSWCDNKRIIVDLREDIMEIKKWDADSIYDIYRADIPKSFHYKPFTDFNYLTFQPTTGQLIFVYMLTIVVSLVVCIWCVKNEFQNES